MMRRCLFPLLLPIFISGIIKAQTPLSKAATDAYIITRMVNKFHVQPRALNDTLSNDLFLSMLTSLDDEKIFFTTADINRLQIFRLQLDEEIRQRKTTFLSLAASLYQQRLQQADSFIQQVSATPFNFSTDEKLTVAEVTSRPANNAMLKQKLYKSMKMYALEYIMEHADGPASLLQPVNKKKLDSIETTARKKAAATYHRYVSRVLQSPGGAVQYVCDTYCESLASCYDPHTEYFPPTEKENFESQLGQKAFRFGFSVNEDEDGGAMIESLKPGSPAFKSGMLNTGDKIVRMQWEGMQPVDVSDADIREIYRILEASNHNKLTLTVRKADGTEREVTMMKELDESDDEDDKVKSFLLKGTKTIGYISLPAFYEDWENENSTNGCANDVAKEIMKLKKENMDGLIIDLRYNGGGSLQEATDLAGIFIDAGPVAQVGSRAEKIYSLKDVNRGTIYDGPLMILINGYSASASEMVAGTLQDYHRAIIAGTPSYGKATGQIVLPMDTTISLDNNGINKTAASYIKVTTGRLYRINGTTAQAKGVIPDILIPDLAQADPHHEGDEPFVLKTENIEPNKYYKPYAVQDIAALKTVADKEIAGDTWFKTLDAYITSYKKSLQQKDVSLRLSDAVKENNSDSLEEPDEEDDEEVDPGFKVSNNSYEDLRIKANEDNKEINEKIIRYLQHDPCLRVAYHVVAAMK